MTAEQSTYKDIAISGLVDLTGKAGGCALVFSGGAMAAGITVCAMPVAAATVVAATKVVNYVRNNPEEEINVQQTALDAVKDTGSTVYAAFNAVRPILFTAGYQVGTLSAVAVVKATGLAMHYAYAGAVQAAQTAQYIYDNMYMSNFTMPMPTMSRLMPV